MNYVGTGIVWGAGSVTASIAGVSDLSLLQSTEYASEADQEQIKDKNGETKSNVAYDHRAKMTVEFIPGVGTVSGTVGSTLTITSWPSVGDIITMAGDSAYTPFNVKGLVDGITFTRSNTRAMMARINLTRYIPNGVPA